MEIHYFRNYVSENLEEFSMIFGHPLSYHGGHMDLQLLHTPETVIVYT